MSDILTAGICSYGHSIRDGRDLAQGVMRRVCGTCLTAANDEYRRVFWALGLRPITKVIPPWQDVHHLRAEAHRLTTEWATRHTRIAAA